MAKTKIKSKESSPVKRTFMVVRLTEAEKRALLARAAASSLTLSSWARMTLLQQKES